MRIALVASLVTPLREDIAGGAQAFLCDLARGFQARRHEVTVYCASGSQVPGVELVEVAVDPAVATALVMPLGAPPAAVPELRSGFELLFRELRRRRHDVVSQHAFDAEAIELSRGLPVLHTLHLPPLSEAVIRACRRTQGRLATVSESSRRQWNEAGVSPVQVLRNGIPDFDVDDRQRPAPVAIIAGRMSPEKGIVTAIRAARQAGLSPQLYGDAYAPGYLEAEVKPLLRAGERWHGPVTRPQLWQAMAAASVTLMPVEWDEPFGLVAAESQVAGCPVVAYRRGGLPEVVEDGISGRLVEPADYEAFVAAIGEVLRWDRALIRASGRSRLSLEAALDAYTSAIERVAS
jgi:glycosyltransferase involved in cell wall biosynthesis